MENLLKIASSLMLAFLIASQILLASPYRGRLTDDSLNGRILKTYETLICRGTVTLDVLGEYTPNTAVILVNGEPLKVVDTFPVQISLIDGDVVEIRTKLGIQPFYVFMSSQKGEIITDLRESTLLLKPGINRMFKVFARKRSQ